MKTATTNLQANHRLEGLGRARASLDCKGPGTAKSSGPTSEAVVGRGKRRYSAVLQAGDELEFHKLPPAMLRGLEERFVSEDTTPGQLSALAARLASDDAPYADFTLFSPFGKRAMKLMTFWAQIFVGGELTSKSAAGPWDFEQWRKCWREFRTAMLKPTASSPGPLDAYEEGLRHLSHRL